MFGTTKPLWGEQPEQKKHYDAVLIGGGLHNLLPD